MIDEPIQTSLFPSEQNPIEQILKEQHGQNKNRQATNPIEELLDPESEESKFLCQLAVMVQQMAPWNFMEETDVLQKRDRAIIKASGFKFPKNQQPQFRSYRPGYLPWFITTAEASHLIYALTQTVNVASRFFDDTALLPFNETPGDRNYLIRIPRLKESKPSWEESIFTVDPPPTHLVPFSLEESIMKKLKKLPTSGIVEVDLFMLPARVGKSHERPRNPCATSAISASLRFHRASHHNRRDAEDAEAAQRDREHSDLSECREGRRDHHE